jgi:hypothetical protein
VRQWGEIQEFIEKEIKRREACERLRTGTEGPAQELRQDRDHPRRQPAVSAGERDRGDRPERRRQVHAVQPDQRALRAHQRRRAAQRQRIDGKRPFEINRMGLSRSFQITNIFPKPAVFENLRCGVLWSLGYKYTFLKFLATSTTPTSAPSSCCT